MREIKFRAWDNVKNKMYFVGEEDSISFDLLSGGLFVGFDLNEDWESPHLKLEHLQYMQYIGRKDIEANDIYEGDILKYAGKNYLVIWEDYRFNLKGFSESFLDYPTEAFSEGLHFKVIGNIYENPELLLEGQS